MVDLVGPFSLLLACILIIFGLLNWLLGVRSSHVRQNSPHPEPLSSLNLGNQLLITAGMGQLILAGASLSLLSAPGILSNNVPAVVLVYLGFALIRAFAMQRFSRKISAEVGPGFCLGINLLWPVLAILFIPLCIIDLWDRTNSPAEFNSSVVSNYAKES